MLLAKVFCGTSRANRKSLARRLCCTRSRNVVVHAQVRHVWKRFDHRRLDAVRFPRRLERVLACRAREVGAGFGILRPDRPLQNAAVQSWWTMSTNNCED